VGGPGRSVGRGLGPAEGRQHVNPFAAGAGGTGVPLMRSAAMLRSLAPRLLFAAPLLLTACMNMPRPQAADASAPAFPVARFFAGTTQGQGVLRVMMSGRRLVQVSSVGRVGPDGVVIVDQSVVEQGKPPRARSWALREVAPGRYAGTLSDAAGPVEGFVAGNRLHLRFPMRGGMEADQWLTLAPDGRSARNILRVRKLGLTVAALEETIRKLD